MRKFLLLMLTLGFSSQTVLAQDAAQINDEDSFQGSAPTVTAPQQAETTDIADTIEVASEPSTIPPAPAPVVQEVASVTHNTAQQQQQEPIDINALYKTKPAPQVVRRPMTEAEKMKLMRAKLEKQNEILMRKQMERMRMKQELEMSKRIQKTFEDSMKRLEETN